VGSNLQSIKDRCLACLQFFKKKERAVEENNSNGVMYTEEQLMARLKFFIGICLALTLTGIVFVVLYSIIFVTQPLNAISPIDQKFFELIIPIATFLTGTLSGIMLAGNDKDAQKMALQAANKGWDKPPTPIAPAPAPTPSGGGFGASSAGTFGAPAAAPVASGMGGFGASPAAGFGGAQPIAMTASGKKIVPEEPHPEI
jgi:hypothetical protein